MAWSIFWIAKENSRRRCADRANDISSWKVTRESLGLMSRARMVCIIYRGPQVPLVNFLYDGASAFFWSVRS